MQTYTFLMTLLVAARSTTAAAASSSSSSSSCPTYNLDFSGLARGQYITDELLDDYGVLVHATSRNRRGYTPDHAARVFDTANPGTNDDNGDLDLGSPNQACPQGGGPGVGEGGLPTAKYSNCVPLGNVLIVQEGDKDDPDDNAGGGSIRFTFDPVPMDVAEIKIFDIDDTKPVQVTVNTWDDGRETTLTSPEDVGNNGVYPMPVNIPNVRWIQVNFVSSGAVASLRYAPHDCSTTTTTTTNPTPPLPTSTPTPGPTGGFGITGFPDDPPIRSVEPPKTGGGGGDPHIKKWDGTRYFYHGECDTVLIQNDHFNNGEGFDIHIRTKMEEEEGRFSFIEGVAIRIGDSIVEFNVSDTILIDGQEYTNDDLPMTLKEGYTVSKSYYTSGRKGKFQDIELNNGDSVQLTTFKGFISVDVTGLKYDFEHSVGMLGDYHTSQLVGRDGTTVFDDTNTDAFGLEWQVRDEDPRLFADDPTGAAADHGRIVYPRQCRFPSQAAVGRRRLMMRGNGAKVHAAETACQHKRPNDFSFCVFDVLATGDVEMADAW